MLEYILQKDRELLIFLNNLGNKQWNLFWLFITNQFNWIPLFFYILYLVLKNFGIKRGVFLMIFISAMITFSDQYTNFIRGVFERLRPINDSSISHLLRDKLIHPKSFSFTSGHATSSMTISVFIFLLFKEKYSKYRELIFLFPLFFAYSRIYLGVHYPTDIIAGAINGTIIGFLFFKLYSLFVKQNV